MPNGKSSATSRSSVRSGTLPSPNPRRRCKRSRRLTIADQLLAANAVKIDLFGRAKAGFCHLQGDSRSFVASALMRALPASNRSGNLPSTVFDLTANYAKDAQTELENYR